MSKNEIESSSNNYGRGKDVIMRRLHITVVFFAIMIFLNSIAFAEDTKFSQDANGWTFPYIGAGNGTWDMSVGLFFWQDTLKARNFQIRGDVDVLPGVRWHSVIRSNDEQDTLRGFHPQFDENYIEGQGFYRNKNGTLGTSLRIGNIRYLHFPYPDSIAVFDQVPGIGDLTGGNKTGYSGEMLAVDYADKSGFGAHATALHWGFGQSGGTQMLENYLFYRGDFGKVHFETHAGGLAVRPEPLGRKENGYNVFLGSKIKGYTVGLLYEKLNRQPAYTGIMVTFPQNNVTRAMGKVAFDYDRNPEGFAMQVPLAAGSFGNILKKAPPGAALVGEVKAERLRTYWQNGQVRNYYEHRLESWGDTTAKDLVVVMEEQPWYLQAEALVSPHSFSDGLKTWEHDRQGPAQLSQKVSYKFYRVK